MDQEEVAAAVEKVRWIMQSGPPGTVITVRSDGSVTTEGARRPRPGLERRKHPVTAFVVGRSPLPDHEIQERIEEALAALDS